MTTPFQCCHAHRFSPFTTQPKRRRGGTHAWQKIAWATTLGRASSALKKTWERSRRWLEGKRVSMPRWWEFVAWHFWLLSHTRFLPIGISQLQCRYNHWRRRLLLCSCSLLRVQNTQNQFYFKQFYLISIYRHSYWKLKPTKPQEFEVRKVVKVDTKDKNRPLSLVVERKRCVEAYLLL